MDIQKLITKGYFPEELIPAFNTKGLNSVLPEIMSKLDDLDPFDQRGKLKSRKLLSFSIPKIKAYRRNLGIPNPIKYIRLSKSIVDNWPEIAAFTTGSSISLSGITEVAMSRAIPQPSFERITDERVLRSTGYKFLLKIDILRFYGSIYTHSIPWAIHTKGVSKGKRGRKELFGNALDEDVRNLHDGQTMGIPIGPDTSRIVSEIIGSYFDRSIQSEFPKLSGLRVVDDYTLYFKNLGDLEKVRSFIFRLLKEFELDLNQAKEQIQELPELIESRWYTKLRNFKFRNDVELQRKDIISYFDILFYNTRCFPEDSVLSYGISKICASIFNEGNWGILEAFLLKSIFLESKVLPYVAKLIVSHEKAGYKLNGERIENTLTEFLSYHLSLDNHFEVSWTLWLYKELKFKIAEAINLDLSQCSNSIIILIALDLDNCGLISGVLDKSYWLTLITKENLCTEHWLLAYEAVKKNWLIPTKNYLLEDAFFKILFNNNVEFYDPKCTLDISELLVTSDNTSLLKYKSNQKSAIEIGDNDLFGIDDLPF